jgi:hypothetical protein
MVNIEDFLPPKPDEVFNVAKGSICDVVDGALDIIKTPIRTAESMTERMKRLAP